MNTTETENEIVQRLSSNPPRLVIRTDESSPANYSYEILDRNSVLQSNREFIQNMVNNACEFDEGATLNETVVDHTRSFLEKRFEDVMVQFINNVSPTSYYTSYTMKASLIDVKNFLITMSDLLPRVAWKKSHDCGLTRVITYTFGDNPSFVGCPFKLLDPAKVCTVNFHVIDSSMTISVKSKDYCMESFTYRRVIIKATNTVRWHNPMILKDDISRFTEDIDNIDFANFQMFGLDSFTKINRLPESVDEVAEAINDFDKGSIAQSLSSLVAILSKFNPEQLGDFVKDKFQIEIQKYFTGNLKSTVELISVILLVSTSAHFVVGPNQTKLNRVLMSTALVLVVKGEYAQSIIDYCANFRDKQNITTYQFSSEIISTISLGALCLLLGVKQTSSLKNFISSIALYDRFSSSIYTIIDQVSTIFISVLEWTGLAELIPQKWRYIFEKNDMIKDIAERASKIHDACNSGSFHLSLENKRELDSLYQDMLNIRWKLPPREQNSAALNYEIRFMEKLIEKFSTSGYQTNGSRPEPAVLMMGGKPGQFKSQLVDYFIKLIANDYFTDDEKAAYSESTGNLIYSCSPENGFWDGYDARKKVVTFDDFGQATDIQGSPDNEFFKFIRAVNERPYLLHMADLKDKGNSYFSSDFIIATTNQEAFRPVSIYSVDALLRRFHVCVWVELKPQYTNAKGQLDPSTLPNGPFGTSLDYHMVDFYPWTPGGTANNSVDRSNPLTFKEVYSLLTARRQSNIDHFKTKMYNLSILNVDLPIEMRDILGDDYFEDESLEEVISLTHEEATLWERAKRLPYYERIMDVLSCSYEEMFCNRIPAVVLFNALFTTQGRQLLIAFATGFGLTKLYMASVLLGVEAYHSTCDLVSIRSTKEFKNFFYDKGVILAKTGKGILHHLYTYSLQYVLVSAGLKFAYDAGWFGGIVTTTVTSRPCFDRQCPGYYKHHTTVDGEDIYVRRIPTHMHSCKDRHPGNDESNLEKIPLNKFKDEAHTTEPRLQEFNEWASNAPEITDADRATIKKVIDIHAAQSQSDYKLKKRPIHFQYGDDKQGREIVDSIIRRNMYRLSFSPITPTEFGNVDNCSSTKLGYILFLKDSLCIMPRHFVVATRMFVSNPDHPLTKDGTIFLEKKTRESLFAAKFFTVGEFLDERYHIENDNLSKRDLIMINFKRGLTQIHSNITGLFPKDLPDDDNHYNGYLRSLTETISNLSFAKVRSAAILGTTDKPLPEIMLNDPYRYRANTADGLCGSLLIKSDATCKYKIMGIHVAGNSICGIGFSSPICQKDFENVDLEFIIDDTITFQCGYMVDYDIPARMEQLYDVDHKINYPNKTQIIKSKLYDYWDSAPVDTAVLSRNAYKKSLERYAKDHVYINPEYLRLTMRYVFSQFTSRSKSCELGKRLMTWQESAFGIPDNPYFGPIDRSTSPGFPYVFHKDGFAGKTKWLSTGDIKEFTSDGIELLDHCKDYEQRLQKLHRCMFIYTDNLKDERVRIEKIVNCLTRLFAGSDLAYLLLYRRYFGSFFVWLIVNRVSNGIAVGVNPYKECHRMVMEMARYCDSNERGFIAGDFKGFDRSGLPIVYWEMLYQINMWYGDSIQNQNVRTMLWLELVQSRHIHINHIYEWYCSLPSGNPGTVFVNSIYGHFAMRMCWGFEFGFTDDSMREYSNNVCVINYGDDIQGSIAVKYRHVFNENIIQSNMLKLGLQYTSDLKGEFEIPLRVLSQISFLKNSYIYCESTGQYVPGLSMDTILTTPCWTKRRNGEQITIDNVRWALQHLALWGKEVYDVHSKYIIRAFEIEFPDAPLQRSFEANLCDVLDLSYVY